MWQSPFNKVDQPSLDVDLSRSLRYLLLIILSLLLSYAGQPQPQQLFLSNTHFGRSLHTIPENRKKSLRSFEKGALILSGGGGKGAYAVGVLEALCEDDYFRNSWSTLVGTSIGALNAGFLAQYNKSEQCEVAVKKAGDFWLQIRGTKDVFQSSSKSNIKLGIDCLSPLDFLSMGSSFLNHGGFCDPSPGIKRFRHSVKKDLIQASDMELFAPASSVNLGEPVWFEKNDDDIVDGLLASGALSPVLYPLEVRGQTFIDGGLFSNTPVLKALEEGADLAIVVLLDPVIFLKPSVQCVVGEGENGEDLVPHSDTWFSCDMSNMHTTFIKGNPLKDGLRWQWLKKHFPSIYGKVFGGRYCACNDGYRWHTPSKEDDNVNTGGAHEAEGICAPCYNNVNTSPPKPLSTPKIDGVSIINFYKNAMQQKFFLNSELEEACQTYPNADILGIVPSVAPGGVFDFQPSSIKIMKKKGYQDTKRKLSGFLKSGKAAAATPENADNTILDLCTLLTSSDQRRRFNMAHSTVWVSKLCIPIMLGFVIGVIVSNYFLKPTKKIDNSSSDSSTSENFLRYVAL
eukprot:g1520.t1